MDKAPTFRVRALMRFSSMSEGHKSRGDEWNTTRDRAYQLMSGGHVEILSGDQPGGDFETREQAALLSLRDPAPNPMAREIGRIGLPSASTTDGTVTQEQRPSMPLMKDGGTAGETQAAPVNSSAPPESLPASDSPAPGPRRGRPRGSGTSKSKSGKA